MTREQIEKMEAGEALNNLIAEKVMGWTFREGAMYEWESPDRPHPPGTALLRWHHGTPKYSTNIAAAWQVVEKMKGNGAGVEVTEDNDGAACMMYEKALVAGVGIDSGRMVYRHHNVFASTTPLAICRAALLATMSENPVARPQAGE